MSPEEPKKLKLNTMMERDPFGFTDDELRKLILELWKSGNAWTTQGIFMVSILNDRAADKNQKSSANLSKIAIGISLFLGLVSVLLQVIQLAR